MCVCATVGVDKCVVACVHGNKQNKLGQKRENYSIPTPEKKKGNKYVRNPQFAYDAQHTYDVPCALRHGIWVKTFFGDGFAHCVAFRAATFLSLP